MGSVPGPADDAFHPRPTGDIGWTETMWLSFAAPDRQLTGVVYAVFRPNLSVGSLGVWVWDDSARLESDCVYFQNHVHQPLPPRLEDTELPCGFRYAVLEANSRYHVSFDDDAELSLDLDLRAIHGPTFREMAGETVGWNILGHVKGAMTLNGEHLDIDCIEFIGRSWSPRPDQRMVVRPSLDGALLSHTDTYAATPDRAFFVSTMGGLDETEVLSGSVFRNGETRTVASGHRRVTRHPEHGYPLEVVVDLVDSTGEELHATGRCVNQLLMASAPGVPFPFWVCGTQWDLDGEPAWGQDQLVPIGRPAPRLNPSSATS